MTQSTSARAARDWKLPALLLFAGLLRAALVLRGGQHFFPDETRYSRCFDLLARPWFDSGGKAGFFSFVFNWHDHPGFMLPGCTAAIFQRLAMAFGESAQQTLWVPALVLSLASTGCIGLTYALARRCGADEDESFLAAFLLACSNLMFFYARHLLPYDSSLALALTALFIGLKKEPGPAQSLLCGLLTGLCFLTYQGYWTLAFAVGLVHLFYRVRSPRECLERGAVFGIGAFGPMLVVNAASVLAGCLPLLEGMRAFSHTAVMGGFDEGWRLPWEYFWHAESAMLFVWCAALAAGAFVWVKAPRETAWRGLLWCAILAGLYLLLVVFSVGLKRFVVYGRLVRETIPFLCLASACSLNYLAGMTKTRLLRPLLFCGLGAIAAFNFYRPFVQRFPDDVSSEVLARYSSVREDVTVVALSRGWSSPRMQNIPARYVLLNAQMLFSVSAPRPAPAGKVVFRTPHPLEYKPYQYEGCTREEREIVDSVDMSMRLVDTAPGAP